MQSNYFSNAALKGLNRIGDVFIPGQGNLPSFSKFGGIEHVDDIVAYTPAEDVATLNMVFSVFSILPEGILRWVSNQMVAASYRDGLLDGLLRQLNIGLKGILFSCYYSGKAGTGYTGHNPLDTIGFSINRVMD